MTKLRADFSEDKHKPDLRPCPHCDKDIQWGTSWAASTRRMRGLGTCAWTWSRRRRASFDHARPKDDILEVWVWRAQ
jgi:hypothetical protein